MLMHHIGCLILNRNSHDLRIPVCKFFTQNFGRINVLTNLMSDMLTEKVSDEIFSHIPPHLFGIQSKVFSPAPPRVVLTDRLFVRRRRQRGAKSLRTTCWPICSAVKLFNPLKRAAGIFVTCKLVDFFKHPAKDLGEGKKIRKVIKCPALLFKFTTAPFQTNPISRK